MENAGRINRDKVEFPEVMDPVHAFTQVMNEVDRKISRVSRKRFEDEKAQLRE